MASRPSPLAERLELVCRVRGTTERAWSLAAGLSDKYLAVQRNRAAEDPEFQLPDKAAQKLAEVAQVTVEWLRFGKGDPPAPVETRADEPADVDLAFLDAFGRGGFTSEDGIATRRLIDVSALQLPRGREAAAQAAGHLLEVVASVRRRGQPVTPSTVMSAMLASEPVELTDAPVDAENSNMRPRFRVPG